MQLTPETSRTWLDVDLAAVVANAEAFQGLVRQPLLPMVKANAYGLGVGPVIRALETMEPWGYGVATLDEAEELRSLGVTRPVLAFSPLLPGLAHRALAAAVRPTLGDLEAIKAWLALGSAPFHLEIDTGMRRSGLSWHDAPLLARAFDLLREAPGWEGIFTHFHSAESEFEATRQQLDRLEAVLAGAPRRPRFVHAANSGGGLANLPLTTDFARPGIYLYGGRVGAHVPRPVTALRTRVVATRSVRPGDTVSYGASWTAERPTTIATLGVGYGDGLPRRLGNAGLVEVAGAVHPIVGRVTMDLTMVDVGDAAVRPGDVATLWGERVSLDDQATLAGTISYELLAALLPRVARRYGST
jgi:alanine racemase